MVMRKFIVVLVICILLSSLTLGCYEDSGGKKKNKEPTANAGLDLEVLSLTEIQFDGTNSNDPDGKLVEYEWDFGDYKNPSQDTSTDSEPKYTFIYPGEYEVTLTITDDDGATATDELIVTVLNRKPVVELETEITANVYEIIYFNITAEDLDGYIRNFAWDFDSDGKNDWTATTTGTTTHFYDAPGSYQATLMVSDNSEEVTVATANITIIEVVKIPPVAEAGSSQTVPVGTVLLTGTGVDLDGSIALYEWDFDGDGKYDWSSGSSGIVSYNYTSEGEFQAKLRVTDDAGLTADDQVMIVVNNTYLAHNVTAEIYIDWNTTIDYLVVLNRTIDKSELSVIIKDIVTTDEEVFDDLELIDTITITELKITSSITPIAGHAIQVQIFYFKTLIGARVLDIVNQSYEFINPELDFKALFDIDQEVEEHNQGDIETLKISSIGELEIEKKGDLFYTSLHGTGEYYAYDTTEDSESEMWLDCTDLWLNVTLSGSTIVSNSISILGHGTMVSSYEDNLIMDLDIRKMRLSSENNVDIENYMYGDGTFSGTTNDPELGITIEMSGDVIFISELIGRGEHKNWAGDEYTCSILRTNVTIDGTGVATGGYSIPMESVVVNTTWNTDFEEYSNNTIYYEYTAITTVANIDSYDSGSGYPKNNPSPREDQVHITDALSFDEPRPRVFQGMDSMILESNHGVKLKLIVLGEVEAVIVNKKYQCVDVRGDIIEGATGHVKLRMIRSGDFAGLTVDSVEEFNWKGEHAKGTAVLKFIYS